MDDTRTHDSSSAINDEDPNAAPAPKWAMDDIEKLLGTIWGALEWYDEHENILARWRAARGSAAFDHWTWWWKLPDDESYRGGDRDRAAALADAQREAPDANHIELIEARLWADDIKDGDDTAEFAETRNRETVDVR